MFYSCTRVGGWIDCDRVVVVVVVVVGVGVGTYYGERDEGFRVGKGYGKRQGVIWY